MEYFPYRLGSKCEKGHRILVFFYKAFYLVRIEKIILIICNTINNLNILRGDFMKKYLIIFCILFVSAFFFCGAVSATTVNVKNTTNAIHLAITAAHPGDTLNLSEGNYKEHNIVVDKNLTFIGPRTLGTPTAVIDGQKLGRLFFINSGITVTLRNLHITNGKSTLNGGGVYNLGNLTISHCYITKNNATYYGGGVFNGGTGRVNMTSTTVSSNYAYDGGAFYDSGGTLLITSCNLNNNIAKRDGGGVYNSGTMTISSSNINYNQALYTGGSLFNKGNLKVFYSNLNSNTALRAGGIHNINTINIATMTLYGSNVYYNKAQYGGGIWNDHSTLTITKCNITRNNATYNGGGGIYNYYSTLKIVGTNINNNYAKFKGGGIYNLYGTLNMIDTNINYNNALYDGGGLNNYNGSVIMTRSTFKNNIDTQNGGAIYNKGNLIVKECNFQYNKAYGKGNIIYNELGNTSSRILHFNRFYGTKTGFDIYSNTGSVDARYNWWGSNTNPSTKVHGSVNVTRWLVLKVAAYPSHIPRWGTSIIVANIFYDSNGTYHNPTYGHVPNGIMVRFYTTIGNITKFVLITNGLAKASLKSSKSGLANVFTKIDNQTIKTIITIV